MRRRTRYLLILIGFIFFLITAPLIVLYVGGITYDFSENKYVKTGILVAETDPNDVRLLVDELQEGSTPQKVKFLKPGEHTVTLKKDGYHAWTKRLEIKPAKTTWIAVGVDKVHLLKNDLDPKIIATTIADFDFTNNGIIYLTKMSLVLTDENGEDTEAFNLPKSVSKISLSNNKRFALLTGPETTLVFDLSEKEFFDISELAAEQELVFSNDDQLVRLQDRQLAVLNWRNKTTTILGENVTAFSSADTDWYILQMNDKGLQDLKVFTRNQSPTNAQVLTKDVPMFGQNQLLVTKNKELFILGDQSLYRVNAELSRLAEGIVNWQYDRDTHNLLLITAAELNRYDFGTGGVELISRSSNPFLAPLLAHQIGYTFFGQGKQLHALELDRRDVQNNYQLIDLPDIQKILTTNKARYLYVQHGDQLTKLTIRE